MCDQCGGATIALETRDAAHGTIRRRRECRTCGHRFSTFEVHEFGFHEASAERANEAAERRVSRWKAVIDAARSVLTTREMAVELGVNQSTVARMAREGRANIAKIDLFRLSKK